MVILSPLLALLLSGFLSGTVGAAMEALPPENDTLVPTARKGNPVWMKRHDALVKRAQKGEAEIVFLGDSLTQGWEGTGKDVWKKHLEPRKAVNFGLGGDRIQNVLWRITEGKELEGLRPKVIIVQIGGGNLSTNSTAEVAEGVTALVTALRRQRPETRILLLGLFPRGARAGDKYRDKIKEINSLLAKLDDVGKQVQFVDLGSRMLDKEGGIPIEMMEDGLHLTARGYQEWAEALVPILEKLTAKEGK